MVCAGAAATRWSRRGWALNNNPVSEVYKLLWRIFEPMLFTLSGYFLDVSNKKSSSIARYYNSKISEYPELTRKHARH